MSGGLLISSVHRCQQCGLSYSTKQELVLHQNMTHRLKQQQIVGNLNQSDSDDSSDCADLIGEMIEQRPPLKLKHEPPQQQHYEPRHTLPEAYTPRLPEIHPRNPLFLCGCAFLQFRSREDLLEHVSRHHSGIPPDGTLVGARLSVVHTIFRQ